MVSDSDIQSKIIEKTCQTDCLHFEISFSILTIFFEKCVKLQDFANIADLILEKKMHNSLSYCIISNANKGPKFSVQSLARSQ